MSAERWLVWQGDDGPSACLLRRGLQASLAVALLIDLFTFAPDLLMLRGTVRAAGILAAATVLVVVARLMYRRTGLLDLLLSGAATFVIVAMPSAIASTHYTVASSVAVAIWCVHCTVVVRPPADLLLALVGAGLFVLIGQLTGRDPMVALDYATLDLGIVGAVHPFVGSVLRSARRSDAVADETAVADRLALLLESEERGRAQARRVIHDDVIGALRAVSQPNLDSDQVRRACRAAVRAVLRTEATDAPG